MEWFQLGLSVVVALSSAAAGFALANRWPHLRAWFVAAGFVLLARQVLPSLWSWLFHGWYPATPLGEVTLASSFLALGVVLAAYCDTSPRRILAGVMIFFVAFFTFAEPLDFAVNHERLLTMDVGTRHGVTLQAGGFDCLPSSLSTVLRRWGYEYTSGEVGYEARTTFLGTRPPRVPGAVARLGADTRLQATIVRTTLDELRRYNVPAVLRTRLMSRDHASALIGVDGDTVVLGEPTRGLVRISEARLRHAWGWRGEAIIVAPDFLHTFGPRDDSPRADGLYAALAAMGYGRSAGEVRRFQGDHGLPLSGVLDWRSILVVDGLTGGASRARLDSFRDTDPAQVDAS